MNITKIKRMAKISCLFILIISFLVTHQYILDKIDAKIDSLKDKDIDVTSTNLEQDKKDLEDKLYFLTISASKKETIEETTQIKQEIDETKEKIKDIDLAIFIGDIKSVESFLTFIKVFSAIAITSIYAIFVMIICDILEIIQEHRIKSKK